MGSHTTKQHEVMISTGAFTRRVVRTTRKHPQVGTISYEGKRRKVYVSFYLDEPVWTLVEDCVDEEEYEHCAQKTVPIEDDPDYCGEEEIQEAGEDGTAMLTQEIVVFVGEME
ncbi:MAG TPA: hypothetical protein VFA10_14220 [Ktedonobacteraceae bacterium]|nr:hypothetical protein [Ktedonobacteraceae bacterium]